MVQHNESLLIIGARGHARAVADVVKAEGRYRIAGLIDSYQAPGVKCFGYRVVGGEQDIPRLCKELAVWNFIVAIGDNYQRSAMTERIKIAVPDSLYITAVHPSAIVASDARIGAGTVVMPGAVVITGCEIGDGCIVNTASSIDHDGFMADWSSLAPGAVTGGYLRLGRRSSIGLGARVTHKITIGDDTVVGAGSLVLQDIPGSVVAYGSPCRPMRDRVPHEAYL